MEWRFNTNTGNGSARKSLKLSFNTSFKFLKFFLVKSENNPYTFNPTNQESDSMDITIYEDIIPTPNNVEIIIQAEMFNDCPPQLTEFVWYDKSKTAYPLSTEEIKSINDEHFPCSSKK